MNVKSKEKKENSTVELVIEVSAAEFEAAINQVYNRQKKNISVPGFRKGKAPRKVVEAMYGAQVFYEEAVEEAYPAAYAEAVKQEGVEAVAYPKLEIMELGKEGFTFKATVTVKPEAKVTKYKGLSAPKPSVKVTEKDIDGELKPLIDRAARLVSVDRKAQQGDTAVIDFEGFRDGVPFEGGKGEQFSLGLGSGSFVPGFEEQVVGMAAGEEKDIDITFPEEYTPELAGAAVVFHVKVHEVKERQLPELDDEFAKDVSEFETLAELRKDLGEKLAERREAQAQTEFENGIMEQLIAHMEVEIPDAMIEHQADKLLDEYAARVERQGIKFEDYLGMMGMSMNDMRLQAAEGATRQVQGDLALGAVAEAEGMEITQEELDAEVERLAGEYKMEAGQIRAAVPEEDLKHDLLMQKARKLVMDSAKTKRRTAAKKSKKSGESAETPESAETAETAETAEPVETAETVGTPETAEPVGTPETAEAPETSAGE